MRPATTGKIIAKHDIGHAQGLVVANFRPDLAGLEIHVGTRWGNYGIRAVYGARGEHLHTFQPDFIGQQGIPVNWSGDGEELIFLESSPSAFGFWNAFGQKVVSLEGLPVTLKEHMYRGSHPPIIQNVLGDPRDEFILQVGGKVFVYTQDKPPANPNRVYAPIRWGRWGHSDPYVSLENWSA